MIPILMKILLYFLIMWLFFILGLVLSLLITRLIFNQRDYTNSSDLEILFYLVAKLSSIFIIYSIIFINIPNSYRFVSVFPFIFAFMIPLVYVNKNIKYLINKKLVKIDNWGELKNF